MNRSHSIPLPRGRFLLVGAVSYMAAQASVGAEVGVLAAWLVVAKQWSLAGALAAALPWGLPLVLLHVALFTAVGTAWMDYRGQPVTT